MYHLTALGLSESQKGQIWANSMALHTKKDLKSKNNRKKKVYVLAVGVHTERKFEINAKKIRHEQGLFFGVL